MGAGFMADYNYKIHSFGCKVNTYDASLLGKNLNGKREQDKDVEVHVINSCAVTAKASQESVKLARRIKKNHPKSKVVITGCAAQVDHKNLSTSREVDLIVANSHKSELNDKIQSLLKGEKLDKLYRSNIFKKEDLEAGAGLEEGRTRVFLKVQDGCDSFCSYCVIPFARGKSRSLGVEHLSEQVNKFYSDGIREVVLTGIHLGDYRDAELGLEDLVEALLLKTKMPRIKISSLEPQELTPRLLEIYQDDRMGKHFHISLQSACDQILESMKRQYRVKDIETCLQQIQNKFEAYVGMDVIVGFPGETQAQFDETFQRLNSLPWTKAHVFPFSPRPQTKAYRMEHQLDRSEILQRSKIIRGLATARLQSESKKQIGKTHYVLPLKSHLGLSKNGWQVRTKQELNLESHQEKVKIEALSNLSSTQMTLLGSLIL